MFFTIYLMPSINMSVNHPCDLAYLNSSGTAVAAAAISLDKNFADSAGKVTLATSAALAMGVGVAVLPVPTLTLATIGTAAMVAGNYKEITAHFTAKDSGEEDGIDPNNV